MSAVTQPTPPASGAPSKPQANKKTTPAAFKDMDEERSIAAHKRLVHLVNTQAMVIIILTVLLILGLPFYQPIFQYYARNPQAEVLQLVPLTMPNMTNRAVLSWATTSITEIMTIGFGDIETKLLTQKSRFTPKGWDAFVNAFIKQKIGQSYKQNQLVLTTVPSNTPVIVSQGVNEKHIYQWRVQMPVIMTYATNNNVTKREDTVIELLIIRVPPEQNPASIGIDVWAPKT